MDPGPDGDKGLNVPAFAIVRPSPAAAHVASDVAQALLAECFHTSAWEMQDGVCAFSDPRACN